MKPFSFPVSCHCRCRRQLCHVGNSIIIIIIIKCCLAVNMMQLRAFIRAVDYMDGATSHQHCHCHGQSFVSIFFKFVHLLPFHFFLLYPIVSCFSLSSAHQECTECPYLCPYKHKGEPAAEVKFLCRSPADRPYRTLASR